MKSNAKFHGRDARAITKLVLEEVATSIGLTKEQQVSLTLTKYDEYNNPLYFRIEMSIEEGHNLADRLTKAGEFGKVLQESNGEEKWI